MRKITHFFSMLLLTLVAVGSVKAQDVTFDATEAMKQIAQYENSLAIAD